MARVAKIVIFVEHTRNLETIRVRTHGKVTTVPITGGGSDVQYNSRTPNTTRQNFVAGVLARAQTQAI